MIYCTNKYLYFLYYSDRCVLMMVQGIFICSDNLINLHQLTFSPCGSILSRDSGTEQSFIRSSLVDVVDSFISQKIYKWMSFLSILDFNILKSSLGSFCVSTLLFSSALRSFPSPPGNLFHLDQVQSSIWQFTKNVVRRLIMNICGVQWTFILDSILNNDWLINCHLISSEQYCRCVHCSLFLTPVFLLSGIIRSTSIVILQFHLSKLICKWAPLITV